MINRLRDSRSFYILLSILLAVLVWLYIRDVENPTQDGTYYGIEIQVSGERVLEERGLTVASISQKTVNITVNAPISVHNDLSRENITATVDVSQCSEPGEYQLACTPKLPSNIDTTGAFFPDSAQIVTVVIDNLSTETKTLELKLEGSVADGYQAGTPVFDPETVELTGMDYVTGTSDALDTGGAAGSGQPGRGDPGGGRLEAELLRTAAHHPAG